MTGNSPKKLELPLTKIIYACISRWIEGSAYNSVSTSVMVKEVFF